MPRLVRGGGRVAAGLQGQHDEARASMTWLAGYHLDRRKRTNPPTLMHLDTIARKEHTQSTEESYSPVQSEASREKSADKEKTHGKQSRVAAEETVPDVREARMREQEGSTSHEKRQEIMKRRRIRTQWRPHPKERRYVSQNSKSRVTHTCKQEKPIIRTREACESDKRSSCSSVRNAQHIEQRDRHTSFSQ